MIGNKRKLADCHYSLDFLAEERSALLDLLEHDKVPTIQARHYLAKKIRDARRRDGPPLPSAHLDWKAAESEAARRGETVIDYIYDVARGKEPS